MPDSDSALLRRVDELESRAACERVSVDYSYLLDERRPELIEKIFHADGVFDMGDPFGRYVGYAAIREAMDGFWDAQAYMHHYIVNHTIDVDGDSATGRAKMLCIVTDNEEGQVMIDGHYHDRYERRDGRWAFGERKLTINFWSPMAAWWKPTWGTEIGPPPIPPS
jgi:hypothetical protein